MSSPRRTVRSGRTPALLGVVGADERVGSRVLEVLAGLRVPADGSPTWDVVALGAQPVPHPAQQPDIADTGDEPPRQDPELVSVTDPDPDRDTNQDTNQDPDQDTGHDTGQDTGQDTDRGPGSDRAHPALRPMDLSQPASLLAALRGLHAVVYIAASTDLAADLALPPRQRRDLAVRRIQALVIASAAAAVSHLVVVSSAMVYGASPDNPVPLPQDAALVAGRDDGLVGDLLAVEEVLETARNVHPGLTVTVLRPAALVGAGADTVITRHFEAPRLLTIRTGCPAWQFCHVDDLATAVGATIEHRLGPVVTVTSGAPMTQEEVERLSGMRHVELSESLAFGTATRLHRAGVLPMPASDLAYAVYPWVVSATALEEAGWSPTYDAPTCLGVLLDGIRGRHAVAARRVDRKDAALGAALGAASASATVALVGTAAVMRRRRRKGTA